MNTQQEQHEGTKNRIFHTPPGAPSEQIRAAAAFYKFVDDHQDVDVDRVELTESGELQAELQFRSAPHDTGSLYSNVVGNFVPICQEGGLQGLRLVADLSTDRRVAVDVPSEWCSKYESGSWNETKFLDEVQKNLETV